MAFLAVDQAADVAAFLEVDQAVAGVEVDSAPGTPCLVDACLGGIAYCC